MKEFPFSNPEKGAGLSDGWREGGAELCCPLVRSLGGGALRGFSEGGIRGVELAGYHMEALSSQSVRKAWGHTLSHMDSSTQAAAQTLPLE